MFLEGQEAKIEGSGGRLGGDRGAVQQRREPCRFDVTARHGPRWRRSHADLRGGPLERLLTGRGRVTLDDWSLAAEHRLQRPALEPRREAEADLPARQMEPEHGNRRGREPVPWTVDDGRVHGPVIQRA